MLSKLPQEEQIPETSAVNGKLVGMNVVLIVMLGVTGLFLFSPYLSTPQPATQVLNVTNNSTNTTPSTTKMHTSSVQNTKNTTHTVGTNRNSSSSTSHGTTNQYKPQGDTTDSKSSTNTKEYSQNTS